MATAPDEIFLSYAKEDGSVVRRIHTRLQRDGFEPWLDEHNILPGQAWEQVISAAIRRSKVFLVFLSHNAVTKAGYIQKEIRQALEAAERLPDGTVFIIPLRLDDCTVPERLRQWQWIDAFKRGWYNKLITSVTKHAGLQPHQPSIQPHPPPPVFQTPAEHFLHNLLTRGGTCFVGRISGVGYAVTEGHFLVTFRKLPRWIIGLKDRIANYRPLPHITKSTLFPNGAPWRKPDALVYKMSTVTEGGAVTLASSKWLCSVNARYWRLTILFAAQPSIYLTGDTGAIYVESDERVALIVMPLRLDDEGRRQIETWARK